MPFFFFVPKQENKTGCCLPLGHCCLSTVTSRACGAEGTRSSLDLSWTLRPPLTLTSQFTEKRGDKVTGRKLAHPVLYIVSTEHSHLRLLVLKQQHFC